MSVASHVSKYRGLQVLRFVAAALVVAYHATTIASEQLGGIAIWKKCGYGIDLFFVLSGFVIVWSSVPLFDRAQGWLAFAERRIVRVVPLYWIGTIAKAVAILAAGSMVVHARLNIRTFLASMLFIPCRNLDGNFMPILGVGWTLNYEMFFYFLFAMALFFKRDVYAFLGVLLSALAIGSYFRQPSWPWPSFYLNSLVLEFYFGMLIARSCLRGLRLPSWLAVVLLTGGFVMLLTPTPLDSLPPVIPEGIPAALIIWSVASLEEALPNVPAWLIFLSEASYSIYLFHLLGAQVPATIMAKYHIHMPWIATVLSIAVSFGIGAIVHALAERPVTNYLREVVRVRHKRVVQPA